MRIVRHLIAVVACIAAAVPAAQSFEGGPGGRLYLSKKTNYTTGPISLKSMVISTNWQILSFADHGTIADGYNGNSYSTYRASATDEVISPEVETRAGTNFANLVMGLFYDNTPAGVNWEVSGNPATLMQTMDAIRITPTASGNTVTIIGQGKPGTGTWCYNDGTTKFPSTDSSFIIMPDPEGTFAGTNAPGYVMERRDAGSGTTRHIQWILRDALGDGDISDDAEDYTRNTNGVYCRNDADYEIASGKLWRSTSYGTGGADEIIFNVPGGPKVIYASDAALPGGRKFDNAHVPLAVDQLDGHDAVWTISTAGTTNEVSLSVDRNDDGDALDANEWAPVYRYPGDTSDDKFQPTAVEDVELIKTEAGKRFLILLHGNSHWSKHYRFTVVGLDASGVYDGQGFQSINETDSGLTWGLMRNMEFDAASGPPPPPQGTVVTLR